MRTARGRRHNNNNSKTVVKKLKENVGTKGRSPKQGISSSDDLAIELPEGRDSPLPQLKRTNRKWGPHAKG